MIPAINQLQTFIRPAIPYAQGFAIGHTMYSFRKIENSVHQGHNYYLTAVFQSAQVYCAQSHAIRALFYAGKHIKFSYAGTFSIVAPMLVSYAAKHVQNPLLKKSIYLIHDNIGTLSQVVTITSSIALLILGQIPIAMTSLSFLVIGVLDETGILPTAIRQFINNLGFAITTTINLTIGDDFNKFISVSQLVCLAAGRIFNWEKSNEVVKYPIDPIFPLSFSEIKNFNSDNLEINKGHLNTTEPGANHIDLDELNTICKQIDWKNKSHWNTLVKKLEKDERWKKRGPGPGKEIIYIQNSIKELVSAIKAQRILAGEPRDYKTLTLYTKNIIKFLKKGDEVTRVDTILRLAVEGGNYCGPGQFEVIEKVHNGLKVSSEETTIDEKIKLILLQDRDAIFEGLYELMMSFLPKFFTKIIDPLDVHTKNQYLMFYGKELGLTMEGAKNDATASLSPLECLFWSKFGYFVKSYFWEKYNAKHIVETIIDAVGTSNLPKDKIYTWWLEWVENQKTMSPEQKKSFIEMLSIGEIEHQVYNKKTKQSCSQIKQKFIVPMLIEMGILKMKTQHSKLK